MRAGTWVLRKSRYSAMTSSLLCSFRISWYRPGQILSFLLSCGISWTQVSDPRAKRILSCIVHKGKTVKWVLGWVGGGWGGHIIAIPCTYITFDTAEHVGSNGMKEELSRI